MSSSEPKLGAAEQAAAGDTSAVQKPGEPSGQAAENGTPGSPATNAESARTSELWDSADEFCMPVRLQRQMAPQPPPDEEMNVPVLVIEPRPAWYFLDIREIWRYRELLYFLTWRDVKVRYKQTFLGVLWAILQPLATMAVFAFFLGRVAGVTSGDVPYPLYVFAGMLTWTFFSTSLSSASQSIVGNQNLVTKVYFPRLIIPMSSIGVAFVDFACALGVLVLFMIYYGIFPGWTFWLAPLSLVFLSVAALGMGTLLAALNVAYRDFRYVVPFMIQFWMFATPTIYMQAEGLVGSRTALLLPLNPAYGLILNFRAGLLDMPPDYYALTVSAAVGVALVFLGVIWFRHVERDFADVI